jgi:hypothetical protein
LRWELDPGSDGAEVEICRDRACTTPVATFTSFGTSAKPPKPLGAGVYFWRLHGTAGDGVRAGVSPTWELVIGAHSAPVDTSWGSIPDIDGDGFADAFTSFQNNAGGVVSGAGVVFAYHGGKNGPSTWSAFGAPGGSASFWFGVILGMAGDVDGDGYPELVVSDDYHVWLYPGGPSGAVVAPTLLVNGQGGVNVVAGLGDANGDGYADFGVGVTTADSGGVNAGGVYVYYGGPHGPSAAVPIIFSGQYAAGRRVIGADINGDGYGDLVTEGCTPGTPLSCVAYFLAGGPTGLASTPVVIDTPQGDELAGITLAGDINGDGYADLFDLTYSDTSPTRVIHVFPGGPTGVGAPVLFATPGFASGSVSPTGILIPAGDVNGDGLADIAVGVIGGGTGFAWIYAGSETLTAQAWPTTEVISPKNSEVTQFSAAGDIDGDGYADFLAGDWNVTGSTYVFFGGANGLSWWPQYITLEGGDSVL